MPPPGLLLRLLLLLAPAGAFVLHLQSDCVLSAEGAVLQQDWVLFFNRMPFTCYDFAQSRFLPCGLGASEPWSLLGQPVAEGLTEDAQALAQGTTQHCRMRGHPLWAQTGHRQAVPKVSVFPVTPQNTPEPIMLACVAWGFYPPDVNLTWLWNGDPVKDRLDPPLVTSNGDWTYQARLTLPVDPRQGGSYSCSVQHDSLAAPLSAEWTPGISWELWVKIGVSVAVLVVGTVFLASSLVFWKRSRLRGYVPLEGDSYPSEGR